MVYAMEKNNSSERESPIDLEAGNYTQINGDTNTNIPNSSPKEEKSGCDSENSEKKKRCKKYPKPPRPPKPISLDLLDQELVNELTELSKQKKARIERMKALRKMKGSNSKPVSSSGNSCALIITIIFCLVILWHGIFSRGNGTILSFHGSPESSILGSNGGLISVQIHSNAIPTISPGKNTEFEYGRKVNVARRRLVAG